MKTYDLIEGGGDVVVTNENRERYVDLYVKYILENSINEQYNAFHTGFYQVCGGPALTLFRHEELELLICGLPHFDFDALERVTVYQNGFSKDSQVIKWFWELVKSMSLDEKKQLLFFTTGNDRAPVGGLGTLKFIIQRNGDDTDRLPTAHTCFNVLMIPNYRGLPGKSSCLEFEAFGLRARDDDNSTGRCGLRPSHCNELSTHLYSTIRTNAKS
jgi:ubiquitin-protein ligase E3 A